MRIRTWKGELAIIVMFLLTCVVIVYFAINQVERGYERAQAKANSTQTQKR